MHIFFDRMLKKLIRESFFNPALHFLALFIFIVVEQTAGTGRALVFALPVLLMIGGYIGFLYRSIIPWYGFSVGIFVLITLTSTVLNLQFPETLFQPLYTELTLLVLLLLHYGIKKKLQRWITSVSSKKLSMMNNISEMTRFSFILLVITALYVISYLILSVQGNPSQQLSITFVQQVYHFSLLMLCVYETVRVFAIRNQLMKEEWWPIVNNQGREIGSIHYQNSLWIERQKFIHPVVRIMVVEGNRILLHQNAYVGDARVHQWDSAINAHLMYGETIDECIQRAGTEFYGTNHIHPVFLTNYQIENSCEYQYVHLFVAGKIQIERINPVHSLHLKWWTLTQICEELNSGIFTDNFIREFELLMRSGLVDTGSCSCDCTLRDTIHNKLTSA